MNKLLKLYYVQEMSDALQMAAELFSCTEKEVFSLVLEEGHTADEVTVEAAEPQLIFAAYIGDGGVRPSYIDADFNLFYEFDGVYLEVYPVVGGGRVLAIDETVEYLKRKELDEAEMQLAEAMLRSGNGGRARIAPAQEEKVLSEDITVWCSANEMEGYMCFLPADEGGEKLSVIKISDKLTQAGIVYGVSPMSLGEASRERKYGKQYLVAKGTLAEDGVNGELIYHFEKNREVGRPKEDERGKVDYRDLSLFEPVKKGQLLISRTLATQGKPGSTVTGAELLPKPGRDVNIPRTKNLVINPEMTTARAEFGGAVEIIGGVVSVSNKYVVEGDCDLSTGNIEFDGQVLINGAVISGMLVKASGDIVVGGVVNEAELISGGNIELKLGIQGNNKGRVTAAGNVKAAFIERAEVRARGDIMSDVIMHSSVEAGRRVLAQGKRGNIVGGKTLVGDEIVANTIGAPSYVQTEVEVGLLPEKKVRIKLLREELSRLEKEETKIAQIELYLSKADNLAEDRRIELTESVVQTRAQTDKSISEYAQELAELQQEAERSTDGAVHCSIIAYPGSKITIGTGMYKVEEQTRAASFKYNAGRVVFGPYEYTD